MNGMLMGDHRRRHHPASAHAAIGQQLACHPAGLVATGTAGGRRPVPARRTWPARTPRRLAARLENRLTLRIGLLPGLSGSMFFGLNAYMQPAGAAGQNQHALRSPVLVQHCPGLRLPGRAQMALLPGSRTTIVITAPSASSAPPAPFSWKAGGSSPAPPS